MHAVHLGQFLAGLCAMAMVASGCTTTLVTDDLHRTVAQSAHCSGSDWVDNSSLAVVPVPIVAFFVPHADLNKVEAEGYLYHCGENTRLINREVEVSRAACIPASLTRIITLGVWQWCPAHVTWEADVMES